MAKPYSQDLRDRVIDAVKRGEMSRRAAARRYERAVGLGRDDPALSAMGLKNGFLSARPIVELYKFLLDLTDGVGWPFEVMARLIARPR